MCPFSLFWLLQNSLLQFIYSEGSWTTEPYFDQIDEVGIPWVVRVQVRLDHPLGQLLDVLHARHAQGSYGVVAFQLV